MNDVALTVGLIVNPIAGIGSKVALRGSDGAARQSEAERRGGEPRAPARAVDFILALKQLGIADQLSWYGWQGLGAELLQQQDLDYALLGQAAAVTSRRDSQACARAMCAQQLDLIIFVGGDGTAVDLLEAIGEQQLCLGIPAGVKMHSGVFAISPQAAANIVAGLVAGQLIASREAEVVDYAGDQEQAHADSMRTRHFGTMRVPEAGGFLQHTKEGGRESEPLAVEEICADIVPRIAELMPLVLGPGSTMQAIKMALGATTPTLRGFDLLDEAGSWHSDVDFRQLEPLAARAYLVMSFTRNQGFLLGRGNLELSPAFLTELDPERFEVVTTRSKLLSLNGRPLLVDCGSTRLDAKFAGLKELTAGYEDKLLYRVVGASMLKTQAALQGDLDG